MFSAFQTFGKLGAIGKAIAAAWSPLSLWPDGIDSPGMWIDPSLLTASFNDYTGTTPVATPGSVADSANPVGLALDIRAGAPDTLGPELVVNGDAGTFLTGIAGVSPYSGNATATRDATIFSDGGLKLTTTGGQNAGAALQTFATVVGKSYLIGALLYAPSTNGVLNGAAITCRIGGFEDDGTQVSAEDVIQSKSFVFVATATTTTVYAWILNRNVAWGSAGDAIYVDNISVREIPGNHMLQATSAARPLESARVNLLTYSEDFSNAAWAYYASTRNALTTAPDGTSTAQLVTLNSQYSYVAQNVQLALPSGAVQLWIKRISGNTELYLRASTEAVVYATPITITDSWVEYSAGWTSDGNMFSFTIQDRNASGQGQIAIWHPQLNLGSTALPYQRVNSASDYTATGITPFQLYDGIDDSQATASFAAGTLINGMDCMIAVRRYSAARMIVGLYNTAGDGTRYFGEATNDPGAFVCFSGVGTPTVWVDGVQLSGGTAVTIGTLYNALTVGSWHILEFRGLNLSTWTQLSYGGYPTWYVNGARGDIMLFPSTASTEDKDAARQYLANKYGVTLA